MQDLRDWLNEVEGLGELKRVKGADANLEIGLMTEVNGQRRGAALLFDEIPGFQKGFRVLTGSMLNARRLALTLGYRDVDSDQQLVSRLQGKMIGFEQAAPQFPIEETSTGAVLQNRQVGADVNLLKFPAPKWHAHDGGIFGFRHAIGGRAGQYRNCQQPGTNDAECKQQEGKIAGQWT